MNKSRSIEVNTVYKHEHGLKYRVDDIDIHDVTGYEEWENPKEYVLYTQLDEWTYPAWKKWVREKEDFLKKFTKITDK